MPGPIPGGKFCRSIDISFFLKRIHKSLHKFINKKNDECRSIFIKIQGDREGTNSMCVVEVSRSSGASDRCSLENDPLRMTEFSWGDKERALELLWEKA